MTSPLARPPGAPARAKAAPVLVFGKWRLTMSADEGERLERALAAHCDEHGSPHGFVALVLDALRA